MGGDAVFNTSATSVSAGRLPLLSIETGNVQDQTRPNMQQVELGKGVFLVASRKLYDPNFSQTVILLTDYNENGTTGLIINKPADLLIGDIFPHLDKLKSLTDKVHLGGPVAINHVQILFQTDTTPEGSRHIIENIFLVNAMSLFNRINRGEFKPIALNIYSGYAGWAAGQLESELLRGDWYLWQADSALIFKKSAQEIWPELIQLVTSQWVHNQRDNKHHILHTTLYNKSR
jgi:putative transcriptional regulator